MDKLYKLSGTEKLYWETWDGEPGKCVVHWGELGTPGESKTVSQDQLNAEMGEMIERGFVPIDDSELTILQIEYTVDGFGSGADLDKRNRLMERMDQTLGWTGLGHCDGGSIGSDTMEVCNFVVDFDIAKQVIELDLTGTEFADFSRIYEEDR